MRGYKEYVMIESKTFYNRSLESGKIYYDVYEYGFVYRPDSDEKISLNWQDIHYMRIVQGTGSIYF